MAALSVLKPEIATFTPGSLNFCSADMALKEREWKFQWEKPYILASEDCVYTNSFKTIREYGMAFDEAGICPELEIFDVGMLSNVKYAISKGYLKARRLRIQYVLGTLGGMPADPESLFILRSETKRLLGDDISWSVSAGGKNQMGIMAVSMAMGGNVRVGLEDALYLERGRLAKNNAELVEKVVGIAKELGREIATPAEAREMIGLKGADQVAF